MLQWFKVNIVWVLAFATVIISLISQWNSFQFRSAQIDGLKIELEQHERDTSIHIDPRRDDQRWNDLLNRLERIERKLDGKN